MKKNMGTTDQLIRLLIAVIIGILYLTDIIPGTWAAVAGIAAGVLVLTSFMRFCPLYLPFGIHTAKNKKP